MAKIKKKKEKGMNAQNKATLRVTKDGFLIMCEQYERMGQLFKMLAKIVGHPQFKQTGGQEALNNVLLQHKEMGNTMKEVGLGIDLLGGKPMMQNPDAKKKKEEEEDENKKIIDDMEETANNTKFGENTFVSNIKPEKKKDTYDDISASGEIVKKDK